MGMQDRDWYKEDFKRRQGKTDPVSPRKPGNWNSQQDPDWKTVIMWLSIAVNVMLGVALLSVL